MKIITGSIGKAFHLSGSKLDTDQIIPARFLVCVTFDGLGENVFADNRAALKGEHPFDKTANQGRPILLADDSFGCGSSREHAVPALMQYGIQAIIATSFAPIFLGNATGNGMICVTVTQEVHDKIATLLAEGKDHVDIDLETMTILVGVPGHPQEAFECQMEGANRENLMTGKWDAIAVCQEADELVAEVESRLPQLALAGTAA